MSQAPQGSGKKTPEATQARRQLWVRALVACGLIGLLLGGLAVFDRISRPQEPPDADIPTRPIAPARVQEPPREQPPEAIPGSSEVKVPPAEQAPPEAEGKAASASSGGAGSGGAPLASANAGAVSSGSIASRKPAAGAPVAAPAPAGRRVAPEPEGTEPIPIARAEQPRVRSEVAEETRPVGRKPARNEPESEPEGTARPGSALTRGFGVHMGIFADMLRAEELRERLARAGIPARVEVRVVAGPYSDRHEAQTAQEQIRGKGFSPAGIVPFQR